MSKSLIDKENIVCKLCDKNFKKLEGLSRHLNIKHNVDNVTYTLNYLLDGEIPKCLCGCGKDTKVYNYKYNEYCVGHTGGGNWQLMYDKDSTEYKNTCAKISKTVSQHHKENPITRTPEQCEKYSKAKLKWITENPEKKIEQSTKMTETKRRQSQEGILQERHYTKTRTDEEIKEIYKRISTNASKTKRILYDSGLLNAWNKDLSHLFDTRISWYGENHYRYNPNKTDPYDKLFRYKIYREFILNTQDSKCFCCNNTNDLCLHHIDENKQNSNFKNLIYVCRSCHMKIHNNKIYQKEMNIYFYEFKEKIFPIIQVEIQTKFGGISNRIS